MTTTTHPFQNEIDTFFTPTTASISDCHRIAETHLGSAIIPVDTQGTCSYTVRAENNDAYIVQFRLASSQLDVQKMDLARTIYKDLVPSITHKGQIGNTTETKQPLHIYLMTRIKGISYLEFILEHTSQLSENSPEFFAWRRNYVVDIARFFALSYQTQTKPINQTYRTTLQTNY
ncbi:uncharacterized protein BO80DRAFT_420477 [Aspergillus ibericus CBS 121593]|uniref:Aminoglycoside phosphotransferase domain-containing protein n=1 Tax=Aspergillus ibericus CBS 121593 TaxID=1448316 RepID=A0A395HIT3_9EURO|nr:hypothetical protein BO80DRAFT_420477 [Aspergillus ibericus CBS 121593]RAL06174.1 hypothetical protein BO80DRAFT_420477 [Aspergillus ibericus CBS 121593]